MTIDNQVSYLPVKIKLLVATAKVPTYASPGDAGADLYSVDQGVLEPGERKLIGTGIALEIPLGWAGFVHPRSGLAAKLGITVLNTPGTIDSGYRGEIKVNLMNTSSQPYSFCIGDRIAQIVFKQVFQADFDVIDLVDELSESERGEGGHGSTGGYTWAD